MKQIQVYITAKVVGSVTVPDSTTIEDIENGIVDIYFHPNNTSSVVEKEDLGADEYFITVLPEEEIVK
jgi:hypothetical protein